MGVDAIVLELNRLYICDKDKYKTECDDWKSKGYRIFRDNKGRHKVIEPPKNESPVTPLTDQEVKDFFGTIFQRHI